MPAAGSAFSQLHQHLHQTRLLGSISSALYYDQNTVMPTAGSAWRAELVAAAESELDPEVSPERRRNLQLLRL